MYHILYTTEQACYGVAYSASLQYNSSSVVPVYKGLSPDTKELTYIVCSAESANEDFPESGIWHVKANIEVREHVPDLTEVSVLVNTIYEHFLTSSIETDLSNSVSNYAVYNVTAEPIQRTIDEYQWVNVLPLDIVCVLKD